MGELQLLGISIWLLCLSPLIVVVAVAVHRFLNHRRKGTQQGMIEKYGILFGTLLLFGLYVFLIGSIYDNDPICAGGGDPNVTYCQGYGMVPHEQAAWITRWIKARLIALYIVLPTVLGASILAVYLRFLNGTGLANEQ